MDATTVQTLAAGYAIMNPGNISTVYLDACENPKVNQAALLAAVLTGWMAATQYIHDSASALERKYRNPDENTDSQKTAIS